MAFEKFDARMWGTYYRSINAGLSVDECPLDLTDEEKEAYVKAACSLEEDRKKHPGVPLFYESTFELDR